MFTAPVFGKFLQPSNLLTQNLQIFRDFCLWNFLPAGLSSSGVHTEVIALIRTAFLAPSRECISLLRQPL